MRLSLALLLAALSTTASANTLFTNVAVADPDMFEKISDRVLDDATGELPPDTMEPSSYPYCFNAIKNGKFQMPDLEYWLDDDTDDCTVKQNDGTTVFPIGANGISVTFPPLADGLDALTVPNQGSSYSPLCSLKQEVYFTAQSEILYAQLSWVDRITSQANKVQRGLQYAKVTVEVIDDLDNTAETTVFETTKDNFNVAAVVRTVRLLDVTQMVSSFKGPNNEYAMTLRLLEESKIGPLYWQWDNIELWVCLASKPEDPDVGGDPHFKTWLGHKFTYHGGCDLILLHSDTFDNHKGLDIHIRTKIRRSYSYVHSAAIRIGDDILEVTGNKDQDFYLNGELRPELLTPAEAELEGPGADVHIGSSLSGHVITLDDSDKDRKIFTIDIGDNQFIVVKVWRDFVSVKVKNGNYETFSDSVGIMGDFHTGKKMSRDGQREIVDMNEYGQEWQVTDVDPMLFQALVMPQYPQQCQLPQLTLPQRRRLDEIRVTQADAVRACEHVEVSEKEFCMYDVLATNDVEMAGAY